MTRALLGYALLIAFVGCGDDGRTTEPPATPPTTEQEPEPEPSPTPIPEPPAATPAPEASELVVVGRVLRVSDAPHCGYEHVAGAVAYEVEEVERGELAERRIAVLHDCPADGVPIAVGQRHRLELAREPPSVPGGLSVRDDLDMPGAHRWWAADVGLVFR